MNSSSKQSLQLQDIYFILFRHKWKIIFFSTLGFSVAALLYLSFTPVYTTTAKLAIPYVMVDRPMKAVVGSGEEVIQEVSGGGIINNEIEIIKSYDLALQVAEEIGPNTLFKTPMPSKNPFMQLKSWITEKISEGEDGSEEPRTLQSAASLVSSGLQVGSMRGSDIIQLNFTHSDRGLVQNVLDKVVDAYIEKHKETYDSMESVELLFQKKADELKFKIEDAEKRLKEHQRQLNTFDIVWRSTSINQEEARINQELMIARVERAVLMTKIERLSMGEEEDLAVVGEEETNGALELDETLIAQYSSIERRLQSNREKLLLTLQTFTEESAPAQFVLQQISDLETRKQELEKKYPQFKTVKLYDEQGNSVGNGLRSAQTELALVDSRIAEYEAAMARLKDEQSRIFEVKSAVTDLERDIEQYKNELRTSETNLRQSQLSQSLLSTGEISTVSRIQNPTPPLANANDAIKMVLAAIGAGIGIGVGLAFLIELFLDQSVKRVVDLERKLEMPVYLSIPFLKGAEKLALKNGVEISEGSGEKSLTRREKANLEPWDPRHRLHTYYEALRDRVVMYFDQFTHKPKIIGVTSCTHGSGATSIASGLAASLSETGDGRVLLVDMKPKSKGVHPFFRGKPGYGPADVFEDEKQDSAYVNENLYLASAGKINGKDSKGLPRRLAELMPKLKARDYDYIIFDMPPVNATSITPRIAASMDQVIMVVESEKVHSDVVKRAKNMLESYNAKVVGVLNKTRSYVPSKLSQEL